MASNCRSVGERFNMSKSTLSVSFFRIVRALNQLAPRIIMWPRGERLNRVKDKFEDMAGIEEVIGAVDGTYVPIKAPKEHPEVYITRKCNYAITLQCVCDSYMKFTDSYVGWPGSVSDTRIFRNSDLYQAVNQNFNNFFTNESFIVGDKAYPVLSWCIPPYINRGDMTPAKQNFNLRISQTRQVIERSFALLFGRFRRLKFIDMNRFDFIPGTVIASCVLHNLCIDSGDLRLEEYVEEGLPFVVGNNEQDEDLLIRQDHQDNGFEKRDDLCTRLYEVI